MPQNSLSRFTAANGIICLKSGENLRIEIPKALPLLPARTGEGHWAIYPSGGAPLSAPWPQALGNSRATHQLAPSTPRALTLPRTPGSTKAWQLGPARGHILQEAVMAPAPWVPTPQSIRQPPVLPLLAPPPPHSGGQGHFPASQNTTDQPSLENASTALPGRQLLAGSNLSRCWSLRLPAHMFTCTTHTCKHAWKHMQMYIHM